MSFVESYIEIPSDPHTPRTFGILNIVYALGLLAIGVCANVAFLSPALLSYVAIKANEEMDAQKQSRQQEITKLEADEKVAPDEKAKAEIRAEREELETKDDDNPFKGSFLTDPSFRDPRLMAHFVFDLVSGLLLNLLMLLAGMGLYWLKGWGRILALMVAWAKILRLLALAVSLTVVVAPIVSEMMTKVEAAMPADGVASVGPRLASFVVANGWLLMASGSIYPIATIVFLRRPSVREAFANAGGRSES